MKVYNWTPSTALDDSSSINPIATPMETTTFIVNYTDSIGLCAIQREIVVNVRDTLAPISATASVECDGRTLQITPNTDASIQYDFDDGSSPLDTMASFAYEYAEHGSYELMLQYAEASVCPDSTSITIDLPEDNLSPNFEWNVEACTNNVASLELLDLSKSIFGEITNWDWQLSNGETATEQEP